MICNFDVFKYPKETSIKSNVDEFNHHYINVYYAEHEMWGFATFFQHIIYWYLYVIISFYYLMVIFNFMAINPYWEKIEKFNYLNLCFLFQWKLLFVIFLYLILNKHLLTKNWLRENFAKTMNCEKWCFVLTSHSKKVNSRWSLYFNQTLKFVI